MHTGEKPFKCEMCDQGFGQRCGWRTHCLLHAGERNTKEFTPDTEIQQHAVQHMKESVHECWICLQLFSNENDMTEHLQGHVV